MPHPLPHDPHRPQFHFLPPANWMNDPNGLIHWGNEYHMFYQYNPNGAFHGTIHWGHAVSKDLVRWQHLPVALAPTPDGADKDGCWSGCAIDHDGVPTIFYTGVAPQVQCSATSSDGLLTWQKNPRPVIASAPPEIAAHAGGDIRDPYLWRQDDRWYMLLGSRIEGVGGTILLYRSTDLVNWEYVRPLVTGDVHQNHPFWTGTLWECPNLLDFGDKQVLLVSMQDPPNKFLYVSYFTGELHHERFAVEGHHILSPSEVFYAPQVMRLRDGRFIMFGWLQETRSVQSALEAGWSGMMSLPLECSLREDGKLGLAPAGELQTLRGRHHRFSDLPPNGPPLPVQGQALEIIAQFEPARGTAFGLDLRCSPDGQERTRIVLREGMLLIDCEHSSLELTSDHRLTSLPVEIGERVRLHIFLDHSCLEVFVDDQSYLASRIYPSRPDSLGISIFSEGPLQVPQVDIWEMGTIWG